MNKTYKLALFGDPVNHSLSPIIHKHFASQFSIDIGYTLVQVGEKWFEAQLLSFFESGGHGANITLPHKSIAVDIVNNINEIAKTANAVNTISVEDDKQLTGHNTDGSGFVNDLKKRCKFDCENKNILILGAGGAAQGIASSILQQNPNSLVVANRTISKASAICKSKNSKAVTFSQLSKLKQSFDLIVHTSSLGHEGKCLEFSNQHMQSNTICYDLSYSKAAEPFLDFSKAMGVSNLYDGLGMLIEQAASSFEIWFDKKPDTVAIFKILSEDARINQQ